MELTIIFANIQRNHGHTFANILRSFLPLTCKNHRSGPQPSLASGEPSPHTPPPWPNPSQYARARSENRTNQELQPNAHACNIRFFQAGISMSQYLLELTDDLLPRLLLLGCWDGPLVRQELHHPQEKESTRLLRDNRGQQRNQRNSRPTRGSPRRGCHSQYAILS